MTKKTLYLLTVMLVIFGMLATATPAYALSGGGKGKVAGKIAAVDTTANTVTVTPNAGGADVVLNVDAKTVIKRNGRSVTLAELLVGDKVDARYDKATMLASRILARYKVAELRGTITAVDTTASTATITPKDGSADVILKTDAKTFIKRNGHPATLADLQVGDKAETWYDPSANIASKIFAIFVPAHLAGTIAAVDTTASTVTVTPRAGGADIVLIVDAKTVIRRNSRRVTLAELKVGDKVDAKYNATSKLAIRILARYKVAEVHGAIAAVDTTANTVTVTPKDGGADVELKVDAKTLLKRNGHTANLADLQAGDKVEAWYDPTTNIASKIFAMYIPARLFGKIAAVDTATSTVTITPKAGGADVVLKVDTSTVIKLNGLPVTLADLQAGDKVMALYNKLTLFAIAIFAAR